MRRAKTQHMKSISERFFSKVSITPECWTWIGSKSGSGYGQFWNGNKIIPAHWFLLDSHPVKPMEACHTCDNPLCVNPKHIFIGTRSDNMRDMVSKGRHNAAPGCYAMLSARNFNGSKNPQSKLTEDQVLEIRETQKVRGSGRKLAAKFGVTEACISAIRCGVNRTMRNEPINR